MPDFMTALGGSSPPSDGGLNALLKQSMDNEAASEKKYDEKIAPITKELEDTNPPEVPTLPAQPKPEFKNQMESFGSAANWLAIFGSMLTRQPLVNALKSSAGVMNAYHAQDLEKYKQSFDEWKQNVDNAVKMHDFERDSYNDLVGKDEKLANIYAAAFKNPTLAQMAQFKATENYLDTHDEKGNSIKRDAKIIRSIEDDANLWRTEHPDARDAAELKANGTLSDEYLKNNPRSDIDYLKEHSKLMDAAYMKGGTSPMNADTLHRMAVQYVEAGDKSVLTGLGYGNAGAANRAQLQEKITNVMHEKGYTPEQISTKIAEYQGLVSEERTLGTQTARLQTAGREADNLGDLLVDASKEFPRSKLVPFNDLLLAGEEKTGDPNVVAYGAALNSYVNAYSRAINPNGVGTVSAQEHARDILKKGYSDGQIDAAVEQLKKETKAAREAPGFVKAQMRGGDNTDEIPPANLLKKDKITTFSDGSEWTLVNGKPTKVK